MNYRTIAFVNGDLKRAKEAGERLRKRYGHVPPEDADIIVALGGDGFMLQTLHRCIDRKVPIYGMNRGSVGFLMNAFDEENLPERLAAAEPINLNPLRMFVSDLNGNEHQAIAINEVSLLRETRMAAKIRIMVDGVIRMEEIICDGVLLSTPAGSTAYNNAVHGPIIPLGADVLALTPIAAFRPRRWRGALLPSTAAVDFEILEAEVRKVSAVADFTEVRDVTKVSIVQDSSHELTLLFDPEHNLEERILREQFAL
ncbi:MAG: NAD kinase [Rhodospirillales bacterium RIFCSPLOWO2_12_FULL_58_28]|nr:MAG: NAD kinase [Rhodospirillales bacterium RIFCSPLOWO2_02_FULL_58_16]OHC77810.1 MAG: NAD kinase [Rhodospirillales bacterium RIFCSPLOWO2_12_FULL_58_28]